MFNTRDSILLFLLWNYKFSRRVGLFNNTRIVNNNKREQSVTELESTQQASIKAEH